MQKSWKRRAKWAGFTGFLMSALIGLDQFGNSLLGGDPDMTISTSCGFSIAAEEGSRFCQAICWGLNLVDSNHCAESRE